MHPGSPRSYWLSAVFYVLLALGVVGHHALTRALTGEVGASWLDARSLVAGGFLFVVVGMLLSRFPGAARGRRHARGRAVVLFWTGHVGTVLLALGAARLDALAGALVARRDALAQLAALRPGDPGYVWGAFGLAGVLLWLASLGMLLAGVVRAPAEPAAEAVPEPAGPDPAEPAGGEGSQKQA